MQKYQCRLVLSWSEHQGREAFTEDLSLYHQAVTSAGARTEHRGSGTIWDKLVESGEKARHRHRHPTLGTGWAEVVRWSCLLLPSRGRCQLRGSPLCGLARQGGKQWQGKFGVVETAHLAWVHWVHLGQTITEYKQSAAVCDPCLFSILFGITEPIHGMNHFIVWFGCSYERLPILDKVSKYLYCVLELCLLPPCLLICV